MGYLGGFFQLSADNKLMVSLVFSPEDVVCCFPKKDFQTLIRLAAEQFFTLRRPISNKLY